MPIFYIVAHRIQVFNNILLHNDFLGNYRQNKNSNSSLKHTAVQNCFNYTETDSPHPEYSLIDKLALGRNQKVFYGDYGHGNRLFPFHFLKKNLPIPFQRFGHRSAHDFYLLPANKKYHIPLLSKNILAYCMSFTL